MVEYGEKFENFFRKGAQILAFSKRNFFSDHPLVKAIESVEIRPTQPSQAEARLGFWQGGAWQKLRLKF